jgi:hypothetical protein
MCLAADHRHAAEPPLCLLPGLRGQLAFTPAVARLDPNGKRLHLCSEQTGDHRMTYLLAAAVGLLLIGLVANSMLRGKRGTEREALAAKRADAYIISIRRNRANTELAEMTDAELRDLLLSGARNFRAQTERRLQVVLGAVGIGFLASVVVGTMEGTQGFAIALVVAAISVYGLNEFMTRRIRAPLERLGLDPERLRVE